MESLVHSRLLGRFVVSLVMVIIAGALLEVVLAWQGRRLSGLLDERDHLAKFVQQRSNASARAAVTEGVLRTVETELGAPIATVKTALEGKLADSGREQVIAIMQQVAQTQRAVLFLEPVDEKNLNGQWQGSLESFDAVLRALTNARFAGQINRLALTALPAPTNSVSKIAPSYRFTFIVSLP